MIIKVTAPRGTCGQHKVDQIVQKIQSYHHDNDNDNGHAVHMAMTDGRIDLKGYVCDTHGSARRHAVKSCPLAVICVSRIRWRVKAINQKRVMK